MRTIQPFTDEQARVAINLAQHYDAWMEVERDLADLPYGMKWKTISGAEYLYEVRDRIGNGRSLGRRDDETQARHEDYVRTKEELRERSDSLSTKLRETCAIYRSLRMPAVATEAARILREADRRRLLGTNLMVVGTNALPAYALEAGGRLMSLSDETDDFDMAWKGEVDVVGDLSVWSMLKAVDTTYTVNSERTFQARNAKAFEFELLVAPSQAGGMTTKDQPRPVPIPEQEWLLEGSTVSQVVVGRDGSPARIVSPDPRWFAMQKLWLARKPERDNLKKPKDRQQGERLLEIVEETMPHYPLDADFEASVPDELRPHWSEWKAARRPAPAPRW